MAANADAPARAERASGSPWWVDWFADPPGSGFASSLLAFRTLLLVHAAVRVWDRWLVESDHALHLGMAVVLTLCAAATLSRRFDRPALFAAVWTVGLEVAITHGIANHVYLELMLMGLFALLDPRSEDEGELLLVAVRWMVVLLLFWAGVQKILYGSYFRAEFLCWMIAVRPPFEQALALFIPAQEIARLTAEGGLEAGTGPYRTDAPLLVLASNAVWIAELVLPAMLLVRRTRAIGAVLSALFVLSIQLVARELMFGLLYSQLVLLVLPGSGFRRIAPVYALAYAYLVGYLLGLLPLGWFLKTGGL